MQQTALLELGLGLGGLTPLLSLPCAPCAPVAPLQASDAAEGANGSLQQRTRNPIQVTAGGVLDTNVGFTAPKRALQPLSTAQGTPCSS